MIHRSEGSTVTKCKSGNRRVLKTLGNPIKPFKAKKTGQKQNHMFLFLFFIISRTAVSNFSVSLDQNQHFAISSKRTFHVIHEKVKLCECESTCSNKHHAVLTYTSHMSSDSFFWVEYVKGVICESNEAPYQMNTCRLLLTFSE